MDVFDKALDYASKAHMGATRKCLNIPYIIHPMEAAVIAATLTDDREVLAAVLLHDTVEDAGVKPQEIEELFGLRVAGLVASETENKRDDRPKGETWKIRKEESLRELKDSNDIGVKILWLSDKLSNMRSFYRQYLKEGDSLWNKFNQSDPKMQEWYYRSVAQYTSELSDTPAWAEYSELTDKVFGGNE